MLDHSSDHKRRARQARYRERRRAGIVIWYVAIDARRFDMLVKLNYLNPLTTDAKARGQSSGCSMRSSYEGTHNDEAQSSTNRQRLPICRSDEFSTRQHRVEKLKPRGHGPNENFGPCADRAPSKNVARAYFAFRRLLHKTKRNFIAFELAL